MNKKLMVQIEEARNKAGKPFVMQKLDADLLASIEHALQNRIDCKEESSLYDFLRRKLQEQRFVKKSGLLDEAGFYTYAGISSNTWSNIRLKNGTPSKETLLKLIIGLQLNQDEAKLLMTLGHNELRESDPRDRIILALIDIRCYDIYTVYDVLEEYGKNGAQPFKNIYDF